MNESDIKRDYDKYKSYYDNAPLAYQSLDENGYILEVNKPWLKALGYSKEDVIGKWFGNFIIPEEIEDFKENFICLKKEGERHGIEYIMIHKDGSYLNALFNGNISTDKHGNFIRTHCIFQDITNQKKLELENRIAREKYESLIENIPDAIYSSIHKADGSTTFISKRWDEWTGYSSESLRKKSELWLEVIHPDDRRDTVKAYYLASKSESDYTIEYRIINKNSREIIYIQDHGICVKDKAKKITRYEGILTNISLQKSIELKLKESEEKYSHLFKSAPYPIIIMDAKGTIIDCNHYEDKITGYKRENLIGKNVFDIPIFPPNFLKDAIMDFKKLKKGEIPKTKELQIIKKDGSIIWVQPRASIFNLKGKIYFQIIMHDITVPKNTELRLRESEEIYRTTINSISDVLHVIDKDFRVIIVNDALKKWYKSVGVNSNPVGLNLLETYNFLPSKVSDEYQKVFETKEPLISFEKIVLNKKIYYTETRKIPIVKENKVEQILTVIRDITESKISEQRLKDSEEKFRTISEESFVGIIISQEGVTIYANQRAADIIGYPFDEIKLMKTPEIINMVHPDDRDFFLNQKTKLFQNNDINALNYTFRARKKNGDLIWVTNYDKVIHFNDQLAILSIFVDITEQKDVEDALKESEERFKTLFEVVPLSIVYSDLNANILMYNNQFLKLHGIKKQEKIRRTNISNFFSKQDIPKLRNSIKKSIEGGAPDPNDYIMLKEDGTEFRAEASSTPVRDKNGIVIGLIGVAQDITNRKKAEIELKESEEKFRTIAEQSFMGIIILQDGLFKYFNQRAADINGYSVEEIQNWKPHEFAKLIHPEDRDFVMEQARKKQSGEIDVIDHYSYRVIKKSGEIAWFDNYSKTINFEGRSADLIMTEDITDKIVAEKQLKESEEFFRTITEQSLLGIIIMQDSIIKYVNDIALNHSGYSRDEVMNLSETQLLKYVHPKDHDIIEQTIAEPNPNLTFRLVTKEGDIKWIDLYNKEIIYQGREAFLITLLDVTEKKNAEQIVKDEITKLKELDELKSEFVYRASHELKTPLNSIVSASTLLIDNYRDFLDERVYDLINVINKGGKRLDVLIGDLLDVSRIDSAKLKINRKKEDIVEIIKSCTHDMTYLINRRNLNLKYNLQEKIFLQIDKIRMEQVFMNLLSNAVKNTPSEGTISITIKPERKFVEIIITDTGVGFTKKEKEIIFKKFGKIERHGKGLDIISEGTGLGLYISKEIIELHGGEIWVESKGRNKGSTIVIRLPNKK